MSQRLRIFRISPHQEGSITPSWKSSSNPCLFQGQTMKVIIFYNYVIDTGVTILKSSVKYRIGQGLHVINVVIEDFFILQKLLDSSLDVSNIVGIWLISLDMSDVDTVWTWGDKRPPAGNEILQYNFSRSHIKLTYNNPNKDFKSVERP